MPGWLTISPPQRPGGSGTGPPNPTQAPHYKILVVSTALGGGGAEKVVLYLLEHLDRQKFLPLLVLLEDRQDYQWQLPPEVRTICLGKRSRFDFFHLVRALGETIRSEKPALILAVQMYANYLTAIARGYSGVPATLVVSEHTALTEGLKRNNLAWLKRLLVRRYYPRAQAVVGVSRGIRDDLVENFGCPSHKSLVIYNPCDVADIQRLAREEVDHPWFREDVPVVLACGRLHQSKDYPLLLRAFQLIVKEEPARLVILGQGEERANLEALAGELGIARQVAFLGFQQNPYKYMARARAFALSSSFEGFGLVLVEAMACGVPVVSTRCPTGPQEIITPEADGLLTPVGEALPLKAAVLRLLRDDSLRAHLQQRGFQRAQDFEVKKIVREYEQVFLKVLSP